MPIKPRWIFLFTALVLLAACAQKTTSSVSSVDRGKVLFKEHCAICHPDGKNLVTPHKTLARERLEKAALTSTDSLVHLMRNPGPGMKTFSPELLSNEDATAIARYVLETF